MKLAELASVGDTMQMRVNRPAWMVSSSSVLDKNLVAAR